MFENLQIAFVALVAAYFGYRMLKIRRAMNEPIDHRICVACGSSHVVEQAANIFSCGDCGYDSGQGHELQREAAFKTKIAAMTPAARLAAAVKTLTSARDFLLAAEGSFGGALSESRLDMIGSYAASESKNIQITRAYGELLHAQKEMSKAALLLDDPGVSALARLSEQLDLASLVFNLDARFELPVAGVIAEVVIHRKLQAARKLAQDMLGAIERTMANLAQTPTYRSASLS